MAWCYDSSYVARGCVPSPRPGDIVRLRNGSSLQRVLLVVQKPYGYEVRCTYGQHEIEQKDARCCSDFVLICHEGEEIPEQYRSEARSRFGTHDYHYQWDAATDDGMRCNYDPAIHDRPRHEVKVNIEVPELTATQIATRDQIMKDVIRRNEEKIRDSMGLIDTFPREPIFPKVKINWPTESAIKEKDMQYEDDVQPADLTGKLFETNDGKFGTLLATNSSGKMVLEIKGSGEVIAVDPTEATLVKPYTILVKRIAGQQTQRIQWQAKKDVVEKGDLLVNKDGTRYVVLEIDTEADTERKAPEGLRRIPTEAIDL